MSDKKLRMVKVVLHWTWDPIGVRGIAEAKDEYDSYASPVLELLERGSAEEEVADYLTCVETERMALAAHRDKNADVAALLRELHALVA
jgi:hypothetical protein